MSGADVTNYKIRTRRSKTAHRLDPVVHNQHGNPQGKGLHEGSPITGSSSTTQPHVRQAACLNSAGFGGTISRMVVPEALPSQHKPSFISSQRRFTIQGPIQTFYQRTEPAPSRSRYSGMTGRPPPLICDIDNQCATSTRAWNLTLPSSALDAQALSSKFDTASRPERQVHERLPQFHSSIRV